MLKSQQELNFSPYTDLYDKLIPQNHLFRKINELIDFSFIREELKDKYCPDNGRTAEDPEYLFKFLFLKCLERLKVCPSFTNKVCPLLKSISIKTKVCPHFQSTAILKSR